MRIRQECSNMELNETLVLGGGRKSTNGNLPHEVSIQLISLQRVLKTLIMFRSLELVQEFNISK